MEYLKINDLEEGMVIAFNYQDVNTEYSHRAITIKSFSDSHITGLCHTKKNFRTFIVSNISNTIQVQCETPKDIVGVGTTVYMIFEGKIQAFGIKEVTQDSDGFVYTISRPGVDEIHIRNPKYFNTTKTACANEWLKAQGLGKINEC